MPTTRSIESLDLVGGSLCLDFANSVNSRLATTHDYISTYEDLLDWSDRAGTLTPGDRSELESGARDHPKAAAQVVATAHHRRDAAFRVFSALASGQRPAPRDVRELLKAYAQAVSRSEPSAGPAGATLAWAGTELARPLRQIDYDAGRLLLSPDTALVKECPNCRWLFLDRSRNRSRRWCDMQVCGSRSKMRRYYASRTATAG